MSDESRWSVDELLARYELEPELADIFVEGLLDREILDQTEYCSQNGIVLYEIDSVDVPPAVLDRHRLSSGNKQRVIALSRELCAVPDEAKVFCLVDRDIDHWFEKLETTKRLRWTSYSSIEAHFLTRQTVIDILVTVARARLAEPDFFFSSLCESLKKLYALRLADRQCKLSLRWVALRRYLSRQGDSVTFDVDRYILALLNSNSKMPLKSAFVASHEKWLSKLNGDIRLAIRGHDLTELLEWTVAAFGGIKEYASSRAIERLLVIMARNLPSLQQDLQ